MIYILHSYRVCAVRWQLAAADSSNLGEVEGGCHIVTGNPRINMDPARKKTFPRFGRFSHLCIVFHLCSILRQTHSVHVVVRSCYCREASNPLYTFRRVRSVTKIAWRCGMQCTINDDTLHELLYWILLTIENRRQHSNRSHELFKSNFILILPLQFLQLLHYRIELKIITSNSIAAKMISLKLVDPA